MLGRNSNYFSVLPIILAALWATGIIAALVSIIQFFGTFAYQQWNLGLVLFLQQGNRATSLIGQSNHFGTLLVISCWAVAYAWHTQTRGTVWRTFAFGSWLLFAIGIYLSGSRTAILNLILAPLLITATVILGKRGSFKSALLATTPLILLAGIFLLHYGLTSSHGTMPAMASLTGANPLAERVSAMDATRLEIWRMAWAGIQQSPWLGHGLGGMTQVHVQLSPEYGPFGNSIMRNAHNGFLELWVTYGLLLGSLFAGLVIWAWGKAWWASTSTDRLFVWLMCTTMLVHAMLEYPLHYGYFFWLFWLLLGYLSSADSGKTITFRHPGLVASLWAVASITALALVWKAYVETESHYTDLRTKGYTEIHAGTQNASPLAQWLFPGLLSRLHWETRSIANAQDWSDEEVARMATVTLYSATPHAMGKLAWVYGLRGNAAEAAWWAERVCRMFPSRYCPELEEAWTAFGLDRPDWPSLPWNNWRVN